MTDLLDRAESTLCGWSGCEDCSVLRETIAEIRHLRSETAALAGILMSALVFVHESLTAEVDKTLAPYLGGAYDEQETES